MEIEKPRINNRSVYEANKSTEQRSLTLLRTIGYFVFIFCLLDYLAILIPAYIFNPDWEFNTVGRLVEQIWSPLLAYFLVFFYIDKNEIRLKQARWLNFFSWVALALSILYFAMFPLILSDAFKINNRLRAQNTVQIAKFDTGLERVKQLVTQATSSQQLLAISQATKLGAEDIIRSGRAFPQIKTEVTEKLVNDALKYRKFAAGENKTRMMEFYKNAIKYILGTFLGGVCMFMIWRLTRWSRMIYKQLREE